MFKLFFIFTLSICYFSSLVDLAPASAAAAAVATASDSNPPQQLQQGPSSIVSPIALVQSGVPPPGGPGTGEDIFSFFTNLFTGGYNNDDSTDANLISLLFQGFQSK